VKVSEPIQIRVEEKQKLRLRKLARALLGIVQQQADSDLKEPGAKDSE
jgi:hypothetical protein